MDAKGWTVRKLAEELAIFPGRVSQATALLSLPESIQEQFDQGGLSSTTAYKISHVPDPAEQVRIVDATIRHGLSRSDIAKETRAAAPRKKAARTVARKARPVRVFRESGFKVTVERNAGVDPREVAEALERIAAAMWAEVGDDSMAA